ncbi:DUF362 domain-containing protein [Cephaloticoccus primus]|uniref:DUF362 domain-containing protein n=1 Tax=Cephaloticoccus primus TaxID=1548207 RepID=UPI0012E81059|nr:DUF362 domain-containing protein [Cephaloticoccus primus]
MRLFVFAAFLLIGFGLPPALRAQEEAGRAATAAGGDGGGSGRPPADSESKAAAAAPLPIWEVQLGDFSQASYDRAVEREIAEFEAQSGWRLQPGEKKKVGLKIYADSGPGMATPIPLVRSVIAALERRGFAKEDIFLVGLNQLRLRMTGYLPSLASGESAFPGHKVYVLESGRFYDPVWFYDSPLPQRFDPIFVESQTRNIPANTTPDEDRKSFLATPLFLDADFWINLPVYTDHSTLGVNGALVNATLWNASNTARFFRSPANAPAAVAEMSAIPELRETWAFTLVSLQHYQFIGGPFFNSLYSVSEPLLWLSRDPVMLDSLMLERINQWRKRSGFAPISEEIRTLEFAELLGVGSTDTAAANIIKLSQ